MVLKTPTLISVISIKFQLKYEEKNAWGVERDVGGKKNFKIQILVKRFLTFC